MKTENAVNTVVEPYLWVIETYVANAYLDERKNRVEPYLWEIET